MSLPLFWGTSTDNEPQRVRRARVRAVRLDAYRFTERRASCTPGGALARLLGDTRLCLRDRAGPATDAESQFCTTRQGLAARGPADVHRAEHRARVLTFQ